MAIDCLIGLGSNQGDRRQSLDLARQALAEISAGRVQNSPACESLPAGGPSGQPPFLNAAVRLDWQGDAAGLLNELTAIEDRLGRLREARWGPRVIDLDLLLFGDEVVTLPRLIVPHPRMAFRRFVLAPAATIAADMRHPVLERTIGELLRRLEETPRRVVLAGPVCAEKQAFAQRLAADFPDWAIAEYDPRQGSADSARLVIILDSGQGRLDAPPPGFEGSIALSLCPVLNLDAADAATAWAEAAAALAAMDERTLAGWVE